MTEPPAPACAAPAPRWQVHRELEGPCVRPAGHDGWHLNGYGVNWAEMPPALDVAAAAALARDIIEDRGEFAGTEKSLASIILNLCDALTEEGRTMTSDWIAQARARCEQGPDTKLIRNGLFWAGQDPEPAPAAETIHRLCDALDAARTDLPRALAALERVRALIAPNPHHLGADKVLTASQIRAALDGDA